MSDLKSGGVWREGRGRVGVGGGRGRKGEGGGGRAKFNVNFNIFIEQGFDPSPFDTNWNKMSQSFCVILKVKGEGITRMYRKNVVDKKSYLWLDC